MAVAVAQRGQERSSHCAKVVGWSAFIGGSQALSARPAALAARVSSSDAPRFFMEEEGKGLDRGLQQAQRQRGNQIAGHGIGNAGCHGDVDHVIAGRLGQREPGSGAMS